MKPKNKLQPSTFTPDRALRQDLLHVESTFDPLDPEADKAAPRLFHKAGARVRGFGGGEAFRTF